MAGSLRIARIAGIGLYVHWTFLLIVLWVAWSSYSQHGVEDRWWGVLDGVLFVLAIFFCVTLHEYGHALAARAFGIKTRDITLLPIGGVARLEGMPEDPFQELLIAIAGPVVNVVIAVVLIPVVLLSVPSSFSDLEQWMMTSFPLRLLMANVMLVLFNLLPAFPMDGGRVLRALLALMLPFHRATMIAARIGSVMSVLFVAAAFVFGNPMLAIAALFIFFAGNGEAAQAVNKHLLRSAKARDALASNYDILSPDDSVAYANSISLRTGQEEFPVIHAQHFLGMLTRRLVIDALSQDKGSMGVARLELQMPVVVSPETPLENVRDIMIQRDAKTLLVAANGSLLGLLTVKSFNECVSQLASRKKNSAKENRAQPVASSVVDGELRSSSGTSRETGSSFDSTA